MRLDAHLTPNEAAAWWRKHAGDDLPFHSVYRAHKNHMSIKAILEYVEPKRKQLEIIDGMEVLPQWYKQGRLAG